MTARRLAPLALAALGVAMAACTSPPDDPPAPPVPPAPPLVGTWRLVDVVQGDSADASRPFGPAPQGYVVYDATGHVFVHVRRRPPDGVMRRVWSEAPRAHLLEIVESYAASFGRWAVDSTARVVTHTIEGESPPATGVLERATPYEVAGTLRIGGGSRRWTFVRVR